jgi:hypothetical protein
VIKLDKFLEGWNEYASDLVMPSKVNKNGEFISWDEMLEPLTIFEAKELGVTEGKKYYKAVNGELA